MFGFIKNIGSAVGSAVFGAGGNQTESTVPSSSYTSAAASSSSVSATPSKSLISSAAASPASHFSDEVLQGKGTILSQVTGSIGVVDPQTGHFETRVPHARLSVIEVEEYHCSLLLQVEDEIIVETDLNEDMCLEFCKGPLSHCIRYKDFVQNSVIVMQFACQNAQEADSLKVLLAQRLYEGKFKENFARILKDSDEQVLRSVLDEPDYIEVDTIDDDLMDFEPTPMMIASPAVSSASSITSPQSEVEEEEEEPEPESPQKPQKRTRLLFSASKNKTPARTPAKTPSRAAASTPFTPKNREDANRNMTMTLSTNRTFVSRGSQIGVFAVDDDGQMQYQHRIAQVKGADGELFTPAKMIMHHGDRHMVLLDEQDVNTVVNMDVETGQVISQWRQEENGVAKKVRDIANRTKFGQQTEDSVITCMNNTQLFSVDWRNNRIAEEGNAMAKVKFTHLSTTDSGMIAVADDKGFIRTYNDLTKRAKTNFPGLGDEVIGIDVSADGSWILATCPSYLLLIPTSHGSTNAFQKAMPVAERPIPRKLQLKKEDYAKYNICKVNFTKAQFNIGNNNDEQWILTSTGPYLITWNFRKIKQGKLDDYKIKAASQDVVADSFRFNMQDQVVVTTTDDVFTQKRVRQSKL